MTTSIQGRLDAAIATYHKSLDHIAALTLLRIAEIVRGDEGDVLTGTINTISVGWTDQSAEPWLICRNDDNELSDELWDAVTDVIASLDERNEPVWMPYVTWDNTADRGTLDITAILDASETLLELTES